MSKMPRGLNRWQRVKLANRRRRETAKGQRIEADGELCLRDIKEHIKQFDSSIENEIFYKQHYDLSNIEKIYSHDYTSKQYTYSNKYINKFNLEKIGDFISPPKSRITLEDTRESAIVKMAEGNPGAIVVLSSIFKHSAEIDPKRMDPVLIVLVMDGELQLYGSRIWQLFADECGKSLPHMIAVLRAVQLGIISFREVNNALDSGGKLDVEDIMLKVQARLPDFNATAEPCVEEV
jgi:hypothetical protein